MDIPVTLLTVVFVYALVKYLNEIAQQVSKTNAGLMSVAKVPLALLIGVGVVFVMAETDFSAKQQFFDTSLDLVNNWSKVVIGLVLGAGAVGLDTTLKTSRNWGENDASVSPPPPEPPA